MTSRSLRRVISDFRRHPWLHFVSVTTITVALLLVGAFLIFFRNVERVAEKNNPRITGTLYLREGLNEDQVRELRDKVFALESVKQVVFKDRDSVVNEIQAFLGDSIHKSMPGSEVFPDVLEVELDPASKPETVALVQKSLMAMGGVQEVDFSEGWLAQFKKIRRLTQIIGIVVLSGIIIGCSFIIANFMGIRHQARRQEIQVARMMGANRTFVLAPFVWEGLIEGLLGASIAMALLYTGTVVASQVLAIEWGQLLGIKSLGFLSPAQFVGVVLTGITMALIGSILVFFRIQESGHA